MRTRPPSLRRFFLRGSPLLVVAAAVTLAAPTDAPAQELDVPYVPTPAEVVSTMLELAEPTPHDSLYDLGSGDGRIVITAAERYGTTGVGVEIDSSRVATAREEARRARVGDRVRFIQGDLFEVDVSGASIVTLYLLPSVNRELRPKLLRELRPGARVVSHDFDMGKWRPDTVVRVPEQNGGRATVHFWRVPAHVAGTWVVSAPGDEDLRIQIDQKFQEVRARRPGGDGTVEEVHLSGASLTFTVDGVRYTGQVSGDGVRGTTGRGRRWSGRRVSGRGQSLDAWEWASGDRKAG